METLLVKMFATALALSQVATTPDSVKLQFDRSQDQRQVARLLQAGCTHLRKAFDIEDINLDDADHHRARRPAGSNGGDQGLSRP